jgi:hypothetical protein
MISERRWQSSWQRCVRINKGPVIEVQSNRHAAAGLAQDGTSMSQIPTYVTGVPNGTEKVSRHSVLPLESLKMTSEGSVSSC